MIMRKTRIVALAAIFIVAITVAMVAQGPAAGQGGTPAIPAAGGQGRGGAGGNGGAGGGGGQGRGGGGGGPQVQIPAPNVSFDRILKSDQEPQNWLSYSGSTLSQRYSQLKLITTDNAKGLQLKWVYPTQSTEKHEATPLVVDGTMYTVKNTNDVVALNATTGAVLWTYRHAYDPGTKNPCCGKLSRGLAILGNTLVSCGFRCAHDRHRCEDRQRTLEHSGRRHQTSLCVHDSPACRQGQGHRRDGRRRIRRSRISRRMGCENR